jgi:protein TonB
MSGSTLPMEVGSAAPDATEGARRRVIGIGLVVALHLMAGYALVSGLGRKAVEVIKRPLQATIVAEVKLPPPPLPAPPKPVAKAAPLRAPAPPLPFVPVPEVAPRPTAPAISALTNVPPAEPAPPTPPTVGPTAAPKSQDMAVACPHQVRPKVPERAARDGISGVVRVQVRIRGDRVQDVQILSGPKVFHEAVRSALLQYGCSASGDSEVTAVQEIKFDLQ